MKEVINAPTMRLQNVNINDIIITLNKLICNKEYIEWDNYTLFLAYTYIFEIDKNANSFM